MKAFEMMSEPLVWVHLHDSIHDVSEILRKKKISGVPVRDESGKAVGVFSQTDLAYYESRRLEVLSAGKTALMGNIEGPLSPDKEKIEGWITPRVYTVIKDAPFLHVIRQMLRRKVRRLFVRAKDSDELIGVVTVRDVLRHLVKRPFSSQKELFGSTRALRLALLLLAVPLAANLARAVPLNLVAAPDSHVWLTGTSTLHPYASTSTLTQIAVDVSPDAVDAADIAHRGAVAHFDVVIPVKGLKSGESGLDKNMYKALKEDQAPEIHFQLTHYKAGAVAIEGLVPFEATGNLSIAGAQREISLKGSAKPDSGDLLMDGEYSLLMSDYGVKPPTLMFGAIKVGDPVVVHFHLKFVTKKGGVQ